MAKGTISIDQDRCKGCGLCLTVCPKELIAISTGRLNGLGYHAAELIDPNNLCSGCGLCAVICPDVSITVYRQNREFIGRLKDRQCL